MPRLSTERAELYVAASKRAVALKSTLGSPPSPVGTYNVTGAKASADVLHGLSVKARDDATRKLSEGRLTFEAQQKSYLKKQYPPPMGPIAAPIAGVAPPVPKPVLTYTVSYPLIVLPEITYLNQMSQFALKKVEYLTALNEARDHWVWWVMAVGGYISHGALEDSRDQIDVVRMENWEGSDQDAKSIVHTDILESLREVTSVALYNNKSDTAAAVEKNRHTQTNIATSSFSGLIKAADANKFYEAQKELEKRIKAFTELASLTINNANYLQTLANNMRYGAPLVFNINPNTGAIAKVSR